MSNTRLGRVWLFLPWVILMTIFPLLFYWWVEPSPTQINYVSPAFLSRPASSREEAAKYFVYEAVGGTVLWRYVEYCVVKPYTGTSHRSWVGAALVWHGPDLPTQFSRQKGCGAISVAVDIPASSPVRNFQFVQRLEVDVNPIKTVMIEYEPIPLRILDSKP